MQLYVANGNLNNMSHKSGRTCVWRSQTNECYKRFCKGLAWALANRGDPQ